MTRRSRDAPICRTSRREDTRQSDSRCRWCTSAQAARSGIVINGQLRYRRDPATHLTELALVDQLGALYDVEVHGVFEAELLVPDPAKEMYKAGRGRSHAKCLKR